MAGDGEKSSSSIRRRLTTSIKRVMSYTSGKSSQRSGSSIAEGQNPPIIASSSAAPVSTAAAAAAAPAAAPAPAAAAPAPAPAPGKPIEAVRHKYRPPRVPSTPPPVLNATERAQALFKRHGLDVKPSDLPVCTNPQPERVQKDIRMRIHRTCHKCDTPYGPDKTCLGCGHLRCKKCPRHPMKKGKGKGPERPKEPEKPPVTSAPGYKKRRGDLMYGITIPGRRGGQELVHKEVRQRVHRKCHRCDTDFGAEKVCTKCKHNRCKKCPRSPKSSKGTKGDHSDSEPEYYAPPRRTYKKPRRRVHWTCSRCQTTFVEKTKICGGCGSNRDNTGIRDPPKKAKYKPTDVEVQRLNDRLKQTSLSAA